MPRKINREQIARADDMLAKGYTIEQTSKATGLSKSSIGRHCQKPSRLDSAQLRRGRKQPPEQTPPPAESKALALPAPEPGTLPDSPRRFEVYSQRTLDLAIDQLRSILDEDYDRQLRLGRKLAMSIYLDVAGAE